jgi:hypothetical protein
MYICLVSFLSPDPTSPDLVINFLPTTWNLTGDECPVPQQSSPTTEQFRAFRVVDLPINLDGK